MSVDVPFQFAEATKVTDNKPAQAGEHAVGDTTSLPKPENKPANLGLYDDSVKDPKFSSEEQDAVVQTTVAISTAADNLEDAFEEVKRVAVALEALRQVPVSHLNPSVIAMFETHLPQGGKRVARESAMTPVNMRKIALESGEGFFASIAEGIRKIWEWIKARFNDFLDLFRSKEAKAAEVEKKLDVVLNQAAKDLDKEAVQVAPDEAKKKQTGTFSHVNGVVVMTYQPTQATNIFFKGFTKDGILATIKELETSLDKSAAAVQKMAKFLENSVRIEKRVGADNVDHLGNKAAMRLMSALPANSETGACSVQAWPKQFFIKADGEEMRFETVPVEPAGEQEPMLLELSEMKLVTGAVKRLDDKCKKFITDSSKLLNTMEKQSEDGLKRMEELSKTDESIRGQVEEMRATLPLVTRTFAHILQGAVFHANLVSTAWLSTCVASVTKNMGAPATESAKTKPEPQGFVFA